jgi:hypothetical protein
MKKMKEGLHICHLYIKICMCILNSESGRSKQPVFNSSSLQLCVFSMAFPLNVILAGSMDTEYELDPKSWD